MVLENHESGYRVRNNSGRVLGRIEPGDVICSAAWSPDDKLVATATISGGVSIYQSETTKQVLGNKRVSEMFIRCLDWHPSGSLVSLGCGDGRVVLLSKSGSFVLDKEVDFAVTSLAWSRNGTYLCVGTIMGCVYVFEYYQDTLNLISAGITDSRPVSCIAWCPVTDRIAVTGLGGSVVSIRTPLERDAHAVLKPPIQTCHMSESCLWSEDGEQVFAGLDDGTLVGWRSDAKMGYVVCRNYPAPLVGLQRMRQTAPYKQTREWIQVIHAIYDKDGLPAWPVSVLACTPETRLLRRTWARAIVSRNQNPLVRFCRVNPGVLRLPMSICLLFVRAVFLP